MKLIVNADDLGLSRGVNFGIADAFQFGVVRSATLMATGKAFEHALELHHQFPGLGVGIHLVLTYGEPLVEGHKTIVDENGAFHKLSYFDKHYGIFAPEEVEREFTAQLERVLESGVRLTHMDSHHHVHMSGDIRRVMDHLAKKYSLPYRGEKNFSDRFYGQELTEQSFLDVLEEYRGQEFLEVMAHPAYVDPPLCEASSYHTARVKEYQILTSDTVKSYINEQHIELVNFKNN